MTEATAGAANAPETREAISFCRICSGMCGMVLTIDENDQIVKIRGDKQHPTTLGFACLKGLQAPEAYHGPNRLLHPLKKQPDGSFARIGLEQALDEIAEIVRRVMDEDGPNAVGLYRGGGTYCQPVTFLMHTDWLRAIGSQCYFTNSTIDQSAKWITADRLGSWAGGRHHFYNSDVIMIIGGNPLVSMGVGGFEMNNPLKKLKAAKARGQKLIVIDPRVSDIARFAEVHVQLKPGEDVTVAAGLIRIVLEEGWQDQDFCAQYVSQIEDLRRAVAPFTPDYVERRAGVPPETLRAAAELFATSKSGFATTSTGSCMSPRSNLSDHLYDCLNVLCGRFLREGDAIPNPGVFQTLKPKRAQVVPPRRQWESNLRSHAGAAIINGQMMTSKAADDILTPGKGRVRVMINSGGNPASTWPDQRKTMQALNALDLLVTQDPYMSSTARASHYILPPLMHYETSSIGAVNRSSEMHVSLVPFQQYAPAAIPPPKDSELTDDWYIFWALAKRLGVQLVFDGVELDMETAPTNEEMLALFTRNARIPLDDVRQHPHGKIYDIHQEVEAGDPEAKGRFEVAPADIVRELAEVAREPIDTHSVTHGEVYSHRLIVRRLREFMNSAAQNLSGPRERIPFNQAFMNPADMAANGFAEGDLVGIASHHGKVRAKLEADTTIQPGVVAMTHALGAYPEADDEFEKIAGCTNLLVTSSDFMEKENAMVRMSAIPVNILREAEPVVARA